MANTQYNYASVTQTVANNMMQTVLNTSTRDCTNIDEYNTVIISGSNIGGNLSFDQVCKISGSDVIDSSLDVEVNNLVDSLQKQKQTTDTFLFQTVINQNTNIAIAKQEIKNNITQTALNSCQQNISNVRRGNTTAILNSNIAGSATFNQTGDISTTCFVQNVAKAVAYNQLKAQQDQIQSTTVGFGNILIIILIVAAVLVIGVVIYFVFSNRNQAPAQPSVRVVDTRAQAAGTQGQMSTGQVPSGQPVRVPTQSVPVQSTQMRPPPS